jgi:GMP synthase (glutamine-hydrolysing)
MTDRPRLALLMTSHALEHTRRNFRRELDADLAEFHTVSGDLPATFEYDGFVVTGSRSSVYGDEDWIEPTREWTREAIDRGLPALGICFGHQLLADALGGTVEDMGEYELGYRTVEHDGSGVFAGIDGEMLVFTTHGDAVTELPPGATETARNDYGIHGFRTGEVFGVQSHPEYDLETARKVAAGKDLADERIERVLAEATEETYRRACEAKAIFENFTEHVRERRDGGAPGERAGAD